MDPQANLREQEELLDRPYTDLAAAARLQELREALHTWLENGGYHPFWTQYRRATRGFARWQALGRKDLTRWNA